LQLPDLRFSITSNTKKSSYKRRNVSDCVCVAFASSADFLAGQELESRAVGRAHVGGPFSLVTHDDKPFTEQNLKGQWTLLYFGFTNCPDICPAELDKMGEITDTIGQCLFPFSIHKIVY
jgi:cytochrome oxidase Cu insertion factor (SCO1/SenC/PrrC family)